MKVENRRRLWKATSLLVMHVPLWLLLITVGIVSIRYLTDPQGTYNSWYTIYYLFRVTPIVMGLIVFFIALGIMLFYIFGWRAAFPDFIRMIRNENDRSISGFPEGRIYWINNYGLSKRINDWLELPEKDRVPRMWYTVKWPWNILLPMRGLFTLTGIFLEDISRDGVYKLEVITRGGIKYEKPRCYNVGAFPLRMAEVPVKQSDEYIQNFLDDTRRDSETASQSDPLVQKDQLRNTAIKVDDDLQNWVDRYQADHPLELTDDMDPLTED